MKWWNTDTLWRVRCVWRLLVIFGVTVALMTWGLKGTLDGDKGFVATLLVLIGGIAVGYGISKVWPEPKR
jgi:hypothetical protein